MPRIKYKQYNETQYLVLHHVSLIIFKHMKHVLK